MQHEALSGFDRPAKHDWRVGRVRRCRDFEPLEQFVKSQSFNGFVDNKPHCPIRRMGTHENDAALKSRIGHPGQRNEEAALQEIVATNGMFFCRHSLH